MKLLKNIFGSKTKPFSKYEPNTLAEINGSPDLRSEDDNEKEINKHVNKAETVKKAQKSPVKSSTAKAKNAGQKAATPTKSAAKKSEANEEILPASANKKASKSPANSSDKKQNTTKKTAQKSEDAPKKSPAKKGEKSEVNSKNATKATAKTTSKSTEKASSDSKKTPVNKAAKTASDKSSKKPSVSSKSDKSNTNQEASEITESKSTRTGKFEIKKSKDGRYVFNLYASNNVIVATSQIYSSSTSALNGIRSVIANASSAQVEDQTLKAVTSVPYPKWEIYRDKGEQYRFRLCASNGSCVCHSQGYTSKTNCKKGIESIIRFASDAEITKAYLNKKED